MVEVYDPTSGTWTPTGAMGSHRYGHSAVLLPSGQVLVAGGRAYSDEAEFLATAEVYDPASGTWAPTGSMTVPVSGRILTLLPTGKVLATGGADAHGFLATADVYDPATGTWAPTGSMSSPRDGHTTTLLPSGKVLVTGGCGDYAGTTCFATAEVYDPASGTWSPTGSMGSFRYGHTATLLPSGRVLVTGGYDNSLGTVVMTAEEYEPTTGTWVPTGFLASSRYAHSATLLLSGQVLVSGGMGPQELLSSVELYTP
jgi:hypothetical protein